MARGLPMGLASRAAGIHRTTAQRWQRRQAGAEPLVKRRGPRATAPPPLVRENAAQLVRDTHGLIGAEALSHSLPGLSRRMAAEIKHATTTTIERERRRDAQRVHVAAPGIVRGFDVMELGRGRGHVLVATDGCVPYRTSWALERRYDEESVAALLERDFAAHGAPLVLRMDRATAHTAPGVRELLAAQRVLLLQGPPHYARYYGQHERQNRDHRAWLDGAVPTAQDLDAMMASLNGLWRRSTLDWCTATERWVSRPRIDVDRKQLARDVMARAAKIEHGLNGAPRAKDLAWRLALKQELTTRGLLRIETGGWC